MEARLATPCSRARPGESWHDRHATSPDRGCARRIRRARVRRRFHSRHRGPALGPINPQINYHFGSKHELWRQCLERLLTELDDTIAAHVQGISRPDEPAVLAGIVRALVTFASRRPELNRIMMHEGTAPSDRLAWLVDTHLAWRQRDLARRWNRLRDAGVAAPVPVNVVHHLLIGAASLLYANAPEARLLGLEPDASTTVTGHANGLVSMLLPGL